MGSHRTTLTSDLLLGATGCCCIFKSLTFLSGLWLEFLWVLINEWKAVTHRILRSLRWVWVLQQHSTERKPDFNLVIVIFLTLRSCSQSIALICLLTSSLCVSGSYSEGPIHKFKYLYAPPSSSWKILDDPQNKSSGDSFCAEEKTFHPAPGESCRCTAYP